MRNIIVWLLPCVCVAVLVLPGVSKSEALCTLGRVTRASATSATCLGCHDGTIAEATHASRPGSGEELGHPIEVDFATSRLLREDPSLKLPDVLVLPAGKVACTTCHDGASTRPHRTSMSMEGSALCLACHQGI